MGYTVESLSLTRNYVLANGVAMLIAYALNFFFQSIVMCCVKDEKRKSKALQRLLENSRVMYWFGIATMFSVLPPFYYGLHNAILGWFTLLMVFFMHLFALISKCDKERSVWSYFYYFYHLSVAIWIIFSLVFGYAWSNQQSVPADSIES